MFLACPHCGFLVALIAHQDGRAPLCPRCKGAVQASPAALDDVTTDAAVSGDERDAPSVETEPPISEQLDATAGHGGPGDVDASSGTNASVEAVAGDAVTTDAATLSPETSSTAPSGVPTDTTGTDGAVVEGTGADVAAAAASATPPVASDASPGPRPRRHHAPSFARRAQARHAHGRRWPMRVAVAALTLALGLQLLLAQRAELAADARWRPLISRVCGALGCAIPDWREPTAIAMLDRSVRPAGRPGVLRVDASFRNDAQWPQAWPTLLLSLTDIDGRTVGAREFTASEYRKGDGPTTLAPGQSATVQFEVLEPGPRIVAFTFEFR
ncbi:DUF3426 domain-containing protein [Montanilutibacter psychrotolerans]|uniref:DUF3426 domain-containing protein n=1 Tax=Montanilutibacter psychrotolerans TaxID=1327343 RepID=A0A3M8SM12_9GAMM|nr:DUF3426 domain-containing protein [Lysobacter psychrotolerans]RNF82259.1 DUF3426 domain-containing protein [Lysobacter psychrotolerans]